MCVCGVIFPYLKCDIMATIAYSRPNNKAPGKPKILSDSSFVNMECRHSLLRKSENIFRDGLLELGVGKKRESLIFLTDGH